MPDKIQFNISQFAIDNNCDKEELAKWLSLRNFHFSQRRTVLITHTEFEKLNAYAQIGIDNSFQDLSEKVLKKMIGEVKRLENSIAANEKNIKDLFQKLYEHKRKNPNIKRYTLELNKISDEIEKIETRYKKGNAKKSIGFDSEYKEKIVQRKKLGSLISKLSNKDYLSIELKKLNEKIAKKEIEVKMNSEKLIVLNNELMVSKEKLRIKKKNKRHLDNLKLKRIEKRQQSLHMKEEVLDKAEIQNGDNIKIPDGSFIHIISWENVFFNDGYLLFKVHGHYFDRFIFHESKKAFNLIKEIYRFRNAPKLIIHVMGKRVLKVKNIEVLRYYIAFLTFSDSFDKNLAHFKHKLVSKFRNYTKAFYNKHLPDLLAPKCFRYLCEQSVHHLPIVPIPELVINNSGNNQIHDSFLFPINCNNRITWIWESIEDSKASYVFSTDNDSFEIGLQRIFDYLTGGTVNKRQTLIRNFSVAEALIFRKRIFHTDEHSWKFSVKYLSNNLD